jgi:tetratricopeptide (TPR) repeat protein
MWPFRGRKPKELTPVLLRGLLIRAAASGSRAELRSACRKYKSLVAEHLDVFARVPEELAQDEGAIDRDVHCLMIVAQCLASDCGAPELLDRLVRPSSDNPLWRWQRWVAELPSRMRRLEYEALISDAKTFIEEAKALRGPGARQHEAILLGHLGQLLFHSGRVREALAPFRSALKICAEDGDVPGQLAYMGSLLEAHCYLADGQAPAIAEQLIEATRGSGQSTTQLEKRLVRLRTGEPLCRVVCVREGRELELDEIGEVGEGHFSFQFRRNRISLQKAVALTEQGNILASNRQYAEAMEKYREASDVDPFDPNPVYQSGVCLLELGAYAQARQTFEEVERLAPGWFRCRTDRWLAEGLENGAISAEEFDVLRLLDDGGLPPAKAEAAARQAVERFPRFAPFYLFLGNSSRDASDAYRRGLELVEEPDLESRLLFALATRLTVDDPERRNLLERTISLKGSLVAAGMARLLLQ